MKAVCSAVFAAHARVSILDKVRVEVVDQRDIGFFTSLWGVRGYGSHSGSKSLFCAAAGNARRLFARSASLRLIVATTLLFAAASACCK